MKTKVSNKGNARMVCYRWVQDSSDGCKRLLKIRKGEYEDDRKKCGWITIAEIEDIGGSPYPLSREGFRKVMGLVKAGKVDGVYMTDFSQLSLGMDMGIKLYKELMGKNVELFDSYDVCTGRCKGRYSQSSLKV